MSSSLKQFLKPSLKNKILFKYDTSELTSSITMSMGSDLSFISSNGGSDPDPELTDTVELKDPDDDDKLCDP